MARDARQLEGAATPRPPYSPVVVSGDLAFTAGQVAIEAAGGIVAGGIDEQTRQALDNVQACLAAAGCTLDDVVKTTVFLADLEDFDAFNRAYASRFAKPYPARSTIGARLAAGLLVEIEAIARLPGGAQG